MSETRCERCSTKTYGWNFVEMRVGPLHRKSCLCEDCTRKVEAAILAVWPIVNPDLAAQERTR